MDYMDEDKRKELRRLFLTLWDKAVGTPNYDKRQWKDLEYLIDLMRHPGPTHSGVVPAGRHQDYEAYVRSIPKASEG